MKVLLVNQHYAPDEAATARLLADVGAGLAAAGHEVEAVCSRRGYQDPSHRYPAREVIDGVRVRRLPAVGSGRVAGYASFLAGLVGALLFGPRPDVVICLSTPPMLASIGLLLARLRRARFVFWVMDVYPELAFELGVLRPGSIPGRLLGRLAGATLRRADRVVALGEGMARRLRETPGVEPLVVHNWADEQAIRPLGTPGHALRETWGWSGRFVVLYAGQMGLSHEFDTVLDAAEALRARPGLRFAFVGAGPRRAEIAERVRRAGLSNVELRDHVPRERLGECLTAGDLHLLTLRDNLAGLLVPSKIYGILAAGRPTVYVGPEAGEVAAIVERGCGTRVANGDGAALVEAILRYQGDPALCEAQGRRGRELFEQSYTRRRGVGAFVELISDLASESEND